MSNITSSVGKQLIYADTTFIKIKNSLISFDERKDWQDIQGAGLYCHNCYSLEIRSSQFSNCSGSQGGAIHIFESPIFLQKRNELTNFQSKYGSVPIDDSLFINCSALQGGAIYKQDSLKVVITQTQFINNTAKLQDNQPKSGYGGAIYYTTSGTSNSTQLYLDTRNLFLENMAEEVGGAIYWDNFEPMLTMQVQNDTMEYLISEIFNTFDFSQLIRNNSAQLYGNDFASGPVTFTFLDQNSNEPLNAARRYLQDENTVSSSEVETLQNQISLNGIRSGQTLKTIRLGLVDVYGQIVTSDSTSEAQVLSNINYDIGSPAAIFPPIVEGQNSFKAQKGIFTIENVSFYATPGYNHSIIVTTDAIDLQKQNSINLMKKLGKSDLDQIIVISLLECKLGQQFTPSGKCQDCVAPSFSLEQMNQPGSCQDCPSRANCLGLNNIGPKKGYWRAKNTSTSFYSCSREDSCLGYQSEADNPLGNCSLGYTGILCSQCQENYYRSYSNSCMECSRNAKQIISFIAAILGLFLIIYLIVASQIHQRNNQLFTGGIYLKFLVNHIQLLLVSWSINFFQTEQLQILSERIIYSATVGSYFLEIGCIFERDFYENIVPEMTRLSTFKIFATLLIPALMVAIFSFVLLVMKLIQYKNAQLIFVNSLICGFHVVYPSTIYRLYQFLIYRKIDDVDRVLYDLELEKGQQEHHLAVFDFGLPSLLIWGISMPLLGLFFLIKHKNSLSEFHIQQYLGYLTGGYAKRKFYWEIIITGRKLGLLFGIVVAQQLGSIIVTLLIEFTYILFFILNYNIAPFKRKDFLSLENYSLVVQFLTLYIGQFMQMKVSKEWTYENDQNKDYGIILDDRTLQTLSYAILIINASYFVVWCFYFFASLKFYYQSKWTRVYLCITQCCKVNQLKMPRLSAKFEKLKLMESENEDQTHKNFLEEYHTLIHRIKKLYSSNEVRITREGIQGLSNYLSSDRVREKIKEQIQSAFNPQDLQKYIKSKPSSSSIIQGLQIAKSFKIIDAFERNEQTGTLRNKRKTESLKSHLKILD